MNATDRKLASELRERLSKLEDEANDIASQLEGLADAEQEKFDNMNEGLQQSEQGQRIESAAGSLGEAKDAAEEIATNASDACSALDNIE